MRIINKVSKKFSVVILALALPMLFAGAHPAQRFGGSESTQQAGTKITNGFFEALIVASENYAGQVDTEKLYKTSITGMLHTLDPHSNFFDRKEWEEFQNDQRSRYSGIGSFITQRNNKVYITSPFNGTPAFKAGVRYGDQIIEINGESTEGWSSQQVSNKLIGEEGTEVRVKLRRLGVAEPLEFKIVRKSVPLPSITNYSMIGDGIGYFHLARGFNHTSFAEVERAIADLKAQGMTALIFDLRGNRGGLVDQAYRISNLFLYSGQKIVSMRGRNPNIFPPRELPARNPNPDDYGLVVLIDNGSASASEIVAGALQDHDRARLVGVNSFGKGLVQNIFQLRDGSGLTLTTGQYYTPSGRLIQREYSNRSFYDYIFHSDRSGANRTEKKERRTDAGRVVYEGGGIDPDVEVKIPNREFELRRIWWEPTFQFARLVVAGQTEGLAEYRIDRSPQHGHRLKDDEYVVNEKVVTAFKKYLTEYRKEYKDSRADEARLAKDLDWVRRQIRYEIVTAAYGQEVASQVLLANDVQVLKAIEEMPKAKLMAEGIRRERAATRSSGGLNKE